MPASRLRPILRLLLAACALANGSLPAAVLASEPVAVMPSRTASTLRPIATGFAHWIETELARSGLAVVPGSEVRRALAESRAEKQSEGLSSRELLAIASSQKATTAVFVELGFEKGRIDVLLRVHETASGRLIGSGRSIGPAARLGASADAALLRVLSVLGADATARGETTPLEIGWLAGHSRALGAMDSGELARAWSELEDDASAAAETIRRLIDAAAANSRISREERARLLAARGEADEGWKLIQGEASDQLYSEKPDAEILQAAGEVQLRRNKTDESRAYFERSLEVSPSDADAELGLAESLAREGDEAGARKAVERARILVPESARAANLLAMMPARDPADQARAHIEAGELASRSLSPEQATLHFEAAARIDGSLAPYTQDLIGQLQLDLGDEALALHSYRKAVALGGASALRSLGIGRALAGMQDMEGAVAAYQESVAQDPSQYTTLLELGDLYNQIDRFTDGEAVLTQAVSLSPQEPGARRSLARSLRGQGRLEEALPLLEAADRLGGPTAEGLHELASVQRGLGQMDAAAASLKKAVALDPTAIALRQDLAEVYRASGQDDAARQQGELLDLLGGAEVLMATETRAVPAEASRRTGPTTREYEALVLGFGLPAPGNERAVLLGARMADHWEQLLLDWLSPRRLDLGSIEAGLAGAIDRHYQRAAAPETDEYLGELVSRLFEFASPRSLDAESIASVNGGFGTRSVFVARVESRWPFQGGACGDPSRFHVELRRLSGDSAPTVGILANKACLPGDPTTAGVWNWRAGLVWGALLAAIVYVLVRGFGTVAVRVLLPKQTRALFAVSVTRRPRKVKAKKLDAKTADAKARFNRRLRNLSYGEKRLEQGQDTVFKWRAARKSEYYVTVRGPLYHSVSNELIGEFFEERTVVVTRGRTACVEFDMRPKDCSVEVQVFFGDKPIKGTQVAAAGNPSSLRYTSNGSAFLYLPTGEHTILVGGLDRAAERLLRIDSFDPMHLTVDLANVDGLVFRDCEEAVAPFLESNFDAVAVALEQAGQTQLAQRMRARAQELLGNFDAAARALQAAGDLTQAAELLGRQADVAGSAELYEQAGDFARAADLYRTQGNLVAAARAYEQAYDYPNAIECHREVGDTEKVLYLLEKNGDSFEAGKLALELGQIDRALASLQQVEMRHPGFGEACRLQGEILAEQGNADFALEKFDEARESGGIDSFPIEVQERYGRMLEEAGRIQDALTVLGAVRRQNLNYRDVNTRIESLKRQVTSVGSNTTRVAPSATAPPEAAPVASGESRYEILEEIGRGGMGVVYKARDKHLGRVVALKRLPDNLRHHPAAVKFFEREARSAAVLNHPNIVTVFDAGQENGSYFITMEMLEGTPLDAIMKKHGALPPLVVARLGVQIATGLHFAHRNKIIHRDIKAANLFLTKDKIVKIMDFGLAKMVEEVRKGATVIGGTPYYMAPEQAAGEQVDHRADLYALGVTLFQLATGRVPFAEGDVSYHHRHTPAPDPRTLEPKLPAPLAELILSLLAKKPEDRMQQAADVVRALQALIDSLAGPKAAPKA